MNTAATWVEVVGIAVFFVACVWLAVQASRSGIVRHLPQPRPLQIAPGPGTSPVSGPAPVSHLEPARVPSPWAVDMLRDLMWIDRQLGERVSRELIRVVAGYEGRESQEVVREITAARHVVKGELAS